MPEFVIKIKQDERSKLNHKILNNLYLYLCSFGKQLFKTIVTEYIIAN